MMIKPLRKVELIVTPRRGRARTYTISAKTVGPGLMQFYEAMMAILEDNVRTDLKSKPVRKR